VADDDPSAPIKELLVAPLEPNSVPDRIVVTIHENAGQFPETVARRPAITR
jgi:hypothetical protein